MENRIFSKHLKPILVASVLLGIFFIVISFFIPRNPDSFYDCLPFELSLLRYKIPILKSLETTNTIIMDLGLILFFIGFTFLVFSMIFKLEKFSDYNLIYAPSKKWHYFLIANLNWLYLVLLRMFYFFMHMFRGDWFMAIDHIGIPMTFELLYLVLFLPGLNIFISLFMTNPENNTGGIFERIRIFQKDMTISDVFFHFALLVLSGVSLLYLFFRDFMSLSALIVFAYLILSLGPRSDDKTS